ncbi:F-box protein [Glycine max]|nr:F-box protein [Glycine max]
MSEVKNKVDFIQLLGPDMSIKILTHLDDPCDLIRVSAVSSSWHRFVIEQGLCKQLCLKMFPEISGVAHIVELDNIIEPLINTLGSYVNWESLKRIHRVYAFLASGLTPMRKNCISKSISASSTDNYPEESILHTLEPGDRTQYRASYWSSKGESHPSVPETLVYKLASKLCLVTEIYVHPFQAYFQHGFPIYSAKAVRFRMGHPRHPMELESAVDKMATNDVLGDNQFIWTYTSPEFPMFQMASTSDVVDCLDEEAFQNVGGANVWTHGGASNIMKALNPAFDSKEELLVPSWDLSPMLWGTLQLSSRWSIYARNRKKSVQKGSRATMCSTTKPSGHRAYTQQSGELGSCHIMNLAEGKRVDVFSVANYLVFMPRRKDSGKDMATIRSWFPNFTIVDKVEGTVLIEPDELLVSDILTLQENRLQKFKLPEPVLCIGGVLLVELLGRVQKQEMDELFYICISHVQAMGRSISPEFDVKIHHPSGKCTLKYCPQIDCYVSSSTSSQRSDSSNPSRLRTITSNIMQRGVRRWEQFLLSALLGTATDPVVVDNDDQ